MIRILGPEDIDRFIELRMLGLREHPEAFGAAYEEGIDRSQTLRNLQAASEENFVLGYFRGETLVGIVGFVRSTRRKERHKGWIWGMYVHPDHQGQGIGKALMENCIQKASAVEGLRKVKLSVTASMRPARRLYKQLGFRVFGVEKNSLMVNGKGYDGILMDLDL